MKKATIADLAPAADYGRLMEAAGKIWSRNALGRIKTKQKIKNNRFWC